MINLPEKNKFSVNSNDFIFEFLAALLWTVAYQTAAVHEKISIRVNFVAKIVKFAQKL